MYFRAVCEYLWVNWIFIVYLFDCFFFFKESALENLCFINNKSVFSNVNVKLFYVDNPRVNYDCIKTSHYVFLAVYQL